MDFDIHYYSEGFDFPNFNLDLPTIDLDLPKFDLDLPKFDFDLNFLEANLHIMNTHFDENSDYYKSFGQIVEKNGFKFEKHDVLTEDGYHLTLYRVRSHFTPDKGAPVVFLQHGILSSADCWIGNHAHNSPAFVFAIDGYDVWLGNNRGTTHSRVHETLNPDVDSKYWDFSFIELGKYDLPAMIGYVLNETEN